MKFLYTLALVFVASHSAFAQFSETIQSGRPGQAIGAFTVGKGVLQFQQGLDYFSQANAEFPLYGFLSNNVIRYGIVENVELNSQIDYQYENIELDSAATVLSGLSSLQFGFRFHINNQNGWIPTTGFQLRLKIPKVSTDFGAKNIAPEMIFVANWNLPKDMSIGTNWILAYDGNEQTPAGKYVINFAFPICGKLGGFIENYGQIDQAVFQTRFDGGLAYLMNVNLQLDMSAGYGNNQAIKDYFISTGVSYRFLKLGKN